MRKTVALALGIICIASPAYAEPISSRPASTPRPISKPLPKPFVAPEPVIAPQTSATPESGSTPTTEPRKNPVLIVINQSKYIDRVSYVALYDYLDLVAKAYPIYQGSYHIYLVDKLPTNIIFPPRSLGGHIPGAIAYVNVKGMINAGYDPYIAITHELAEMATDPNLDTYDASGKLLEIADGLTNYFILDGYTVANFIQP